MNPIPDWCKSVPGLANASDAILRTIETNAWPLAWPAGTRLAGPDLPVPDFLFLQSGRVRLCKPSDVAGERMLMNLVPSEDCALTSACLMACSELAIEVVAETDIKAVAIPRGVIDGLIARSSEFRALMFKCCSDCIAELRMFVEDVAFRRVDIRLAERLLDLCRDTGKPGPTHGQLSVEIGSPRHVVTRQLREFQRRGWLYVTGGTVRLTDTDALQGLIDAGSLLGPGPCSN